jgi:hypothetical protein
MYIYYNSLVALLAIIIFLIMIDKNVADYIIIIFKLFKINFQRMMWMIRYHPQNPITNLIKRFEYNKIAKELHKELTNVSIQNKKD